MKIKDLIKELSEVNPELEVVMSKDAEGNSFSPLSDIGICKYTAETTWYGEVDNCKKGKENAVCLWPVN